MSKNKKPKPELDTETTFADMNVEGFKWYDPHAKKQDPNMRKHKQKMSGKEYRKLVRAEFAAYLPVILIVAAVFLLMGLIGWLWIS